MLKVFFFAATRASGSSSLLERFHLVLNVNLKLFQQLLCVGQLLLVTISVYLLDGGATLNLVESLRWLDALAFLLICDDCFFLIDDALLRVCLADLLRVHNFWSY